MDRKIPNIRHLRAFCEVSHCKSISKASDRVYLSQPAITQAIAKLENMLNLSLFDRRPEGMLTTEPGLLFLDRIERLLAHLNKATTEAIRIGTKKKPKSNIYFDRMLTTVQLKALIAVSEAGNFSLAARNIGTTQPSLHRAARELEKLLGIPLFTKSKEGIKLTKAAHPLVQHAKLAFAELEQGFVEIEAWHGRDSGTIIIGSMPLARTNLLPKTINKFTQTHPTIQIRIVDGPYSDLLHGLRHGDIDFLIGALRYPLPIDDITQEPLFDDMLSIVVGAEHPLIQSQTPKLKDLARFPWIVPRQGTPSRDCFNAMFQNADTPKPDKLIETSSLALIRSLLHESDRIALLSKHQIQLEEQLGILASLPFVMPETKRPIGLTLRQGWKPTASQNLFLDLLRKIGKDKFSQNFK
ncbi:MAG: LysR family transcriptional regulator [Emcibacter sp.]|nr:LysR family transcriptional regulator [Emcibacter sp.]